jgi:hypothetical protein
LGLEARAFVMGKRMGLCLKQKLVSVAWLLALLCLSPVVFAEETTYDSALWMGALALWENENSLDYSVEYQLRLDDHMSSYSNDFVEFMGFKKYNENVLFNGGYRFTRRTDHNESRLYFGSFLDLTKTARGIVINPDQFRVTLQIGYQHDFNAKFDDRLMGSNSIRWILVASKPASKRMTPFLLAGVLTTWNDAYDFGVDKIRLGGGISIHATPRSRVRCQYIWEQSRFMTPEKRTNILWLRYEMILGK